jgi:hypothetical protein
MTSKHLLHWNKYNSNTPPLTCTIKCAVCTWKNYFMVGIDELPPSFLLAHWCRLMTQSNTTLNMMRLCCLSPLLSAHEALERTFLFDAMPMAPLGAEVLVHQKPGQRKTWGYYAVKAWYLSHAAAHYRCICFIMKETGVNALRTHSAINIMRSFSWS